MTFLWGGVFLLSLVSFFFRMRAKDGRSDPMSRREEWRKVLDAEVARWSKLSWEQLVTELHEVRAYQVEVESKQHQVEVQLLENTEEWGDMIPIPLRIMLSSSVWLDWRVS